MSWKPTTAQIELILQYGGAGWPTDRIALALGVPLADLAAYGARLARGRSLAHAEAGHARKDVVGEALNYAGPGSRRFHE